MTSAIPRIKTLLAASLFLATGLFALYLGFHKTTLYPATEAIKNVSYMAAITETKKLAPVQQQLLRNHQASPLIDTLRNYSIARAGVAMRKTKSADNIWQKQMLRTLASRPLWDKSWMLYAHNEVISQRETQGPALELTHQRHAYSYSTSPELVFLGLLSWSKLTEEQRLQIAKLKLFCQRHAIEVDFKRIEQSMGIEQQVAQYSKAAKASLEAEYGHAL